MPDFSFDLRCDQCKRIMSGTVSKTEVWVEACSWCQSVAKDGAVKEARKEFDSELKDAIAEVRDEVEEHWNAILNTGAK
jgi:hypothetical protein